jgi:hypothetical protein
MKTKIFLGRDVEVVRETKDGLELDGYIRLRPGFLVEVLSVRGGTMTRGGSAVVWSWRIRALGSRGPIYRGTCRWHRTKGNELPAGSAALPPTAEEG